MATISFTTTFDLTGTPKIFTLEDTSDYVGQGIALANVNGSFKITAPSGSVVYNNTTYSNAGCDIKNSTSRINQLVINLPLAADGFPETGTYTIVYTVADVTGATVYYTDTNTYTYEYTRPEIEITQDVDCVSPLFTSTDSTDYVVESITPTITRVHLIYYPVGSAGAGSPTTGSGLTVTSSTFYNGTQTTEITSTLSYTFTDGLIVLDEITGSLEVLVDCSDTCAIYCCVRSIEQQMINYSTTNTALYASTRMLFSQIMGLVGMVVLARNCGKSTDISGYLNSIKTLANCTDDCSCSGTTPTQVYGLGGLVNNVVVVSGNASATVTPVTVGSTTTYTITVAQTVPLEATLTISSASILALNSTPITIVSAPGAGKYIEVISASASMTYVSAPYATYTTLQLINAGADTAQSTNTTILASTVTRNTRFGGATAPTAGQTQIITNTALQVKVETGNPTGGDSLVTVKVYYRIVTI